MLRHKEYTHTLFKCQFFSQIFFEACSPHSRNTAISVYQLNLSNCSIVLPLMLSKNLILHNTLWQGGGWCDTVRSCVYRKKTRRGSLNHMEKEVVFAGILSNKVELNPGKGTISERFEPVHLSVDRYKYYFLYSLMLPKCSCLLIQIFSIGIE